MRRWTPKTLYDAKPWAFVCIGAALAIVGGATLQLRQDYRARSKWRRDAPP